MREFFHSYGFCPRCGTRYGARSFDPTLVMFTCGSCSYEFYQHSVLAATAVVPSAYDRGCIMFITRRTQPYDGLLALPGGILRYGEDPSAAAIRETTEETTVTPRVDRLLCATRVDYPYRGSWISILELAYLMQPMTIDLRAVSTPEAVKVEFLDVGRIISASDALAFPEQAHVLEAYRGVHAFSIH